MSWSDLSSPALAHVLTQHLGDWALTYAIVAIMLALGTGLERLHPVETRQPAAASRFGVVYPMLNTAIDHFVRPMTTLFSVALVHAFGGGWIALPSGWVGTAVSFGVLLFFVDGLEYVFHRLQHRVPALWRMHSFHHSARYFNVTVTPRHYWLEAAIKMCCLYPLIGIVFRVDPSIVGAVNVVFLLGNYFAHLNLRVGLGPIGAWFNNPQYHRLHHSREVEHFDRNFAQLLPVWDWLFGTMQRPRKDEWPQTGLDDGSLPHSLLDAFFWPWLDRTAGSDSGDAIGYEAGYPVVYETEREIGRRT